MAALKVFFPADHATLHNPDFKEDTQAYRECPERAASILKALAGDSKFAAATPVRETSHGLGPIEAVHDKQYLAFLAGIWKAFAESATSLQLGRAYFVAETFAVSRCCGGLRRKPAAVLAQAGFYAFDRYTPIVAGTYQAALHSANVVLSAADAVLAGDRAAYALCRPPGHHAGRELYGGYCFLNNAAIAAEYLLGGSSSKRAPAAAAAATTATTAATAAAPAAAKVAILDVDYHHGNGTQEIFYTRGDVLYVSIHTDPDTGGEPYFSGYADELGEGAGVGANRNFPLPGVVDVPTYLATLEKALAVVRDYQPQSLVVSLGCDIQEGDKIGCWKINADGFAAIGERIAALKLPTLVVQEGGYNEERIGENVRRFLEPFCG